jgi:hypothetical protein
MIELAAVYGFFAVVISLDQYSRHWRTANRWWPLGAVFFGFLWPLWIVMVISDIIDDI